MGVKIVNPGVLLTVQDGGRRGYQRYGIAEAGAADRDSMAIANILAGNDKDEALLEASLIGPVMEFTADCAIALTGADMSPEINGSPVEMYSTIKASAGDILSFKGLKKGLRTYIAFAGGLSVGRELGSASTDIKAGLGGIEGRALKAGDELSFAKEFDPEKDLTGRSAERPRELDGNYELRVIPGPEDDRFTEKGIKTFFDSEYIVDASSDRMGVRLSGPEIKHIDGADIISNGIPLGGIQVADNGQPMIMLSDRQTTGGYTKIGCVASVDIPLIAQAKPGDHIRFRRISVEDAQTLLRERENYYEELKRRLNESKEMQQPDMEKYRIIVNDKLFVIEIEKR